MTNYMTDSHRFNALADPTRAAIVARLAEGDTTVRVLAAPTGLSLPTVLRHLSVLEEAGLVVTEKDGRQRHCRLNAPALRAAADWIAARAAEWEARTDRLDRLSASLERMETGMEPLGPFDLELTRHLKAGRSAVWRCWTEPSLMEAWFCPRPWRATDIEIDLARGGRFRTVIRGPEGEVFDNAPGCFLLVEPMSRLVWTSALGPGFRPLITPAGGFAMTAVLTFEEAGNGGTLYRAVVRHADAAGKAAHEAMGFHDGWGAAAAQLEELAATLPGG